MSVDRRAMAAAAGAAIIAAVVMLVPIGGDTRLVACGGDGSDCAVGSYYWSVGLAAVWIATEIVGRELHLVLFDRDAVVVGAIVVVAAAASSYRAVAARSGRKLHL